jgi:glycosyltransferase involved in cell wall biosynthesis
MAEKKGKICLLPQKLGRGGGASFQARFIEEMLARDIQINHDADDKACKFILVNGGTRHLPSLWRAKQRGARIVQRLDGFNWIHRKRRTGIYHYLRSEINNGILAFIRRYFADAIIYQSRYVLQHWDLAFGRVEASATVVYNGVDLNQYCPSKENARPEDHIRLLVVEGSLSGGHEVGLENAIILGETLQKLQNTPIELSIAAYVDDKVRKFWEGKSSLWITWHGVVPREQIADLDRSAHLLFSAEINAPCPNSVIEALACGLPVISYATGSLPELVSKDSGKLVHYGANYDCLGPPDVNALTNATLKLLSDLQHYQHGARAHAEERFNIDQMVEAYLQVLHS